MVVKYKTNGEEHRYIINLFTIKELEFAQKTKPNTLVYLFPLDEGQEPLSVEFKKIVAEKLE